MIKPIVKAIKVINIKLMRIRVFIDSMIKSDATFSVPWGLYVSIIT